MRVFAKVWSLMVVGRYRLGKRWMGVTILNTVWFGVHLETEPVSGDRVHWVRKTENNAKAEQADRGL